MNLKEAFRYQNFYTSMRDSALMEIMLNDFIDVREKHFKVNADGGQDIEEKTVKHSGKYEMDGLIAVLKYLMDEHCNLATAINDAKESCGGLDLFYDTNKFVQSVIISLQRQKEEPESGEREGRGYTFNADGNQVPYVYPIEYEEYCSYDRDAFREFLLMAMDKRDDTANKIDEVLAKESVKYEPDVSPNVSFREIYNFVNKQA